MTNLIAQPELMAAAAADLAEIRSSLGAANAAAAGSTTGLLPAAADEVSAACAKLFSTYGQEYQAVIARMSALHGQFAQAVAAGGLSYVETEIANAAAAAGGSLGGGTSAAAPPVTPPPPPAPVPDPARTISLIMGASGYPIPSEEYVQELLPLYYPSSALSPRIGLPTPEGLYPLTGVKDLTLQVSAARGAQILQDAILQNVPAGTDTGNPFTINVLGYSQSSSISSMVMQTFNPHNIPGDTTGLPEGVNLHFTLLGDPSNPNGGLLARFPGLNIPSLGIQFGLATPDNSFPTDIYSIQYDGFADFPQYPINVLSDLNAFLGIIELHGQYPYMTPDQITNAISLGNGGSLTNYYIIDTGHLPIADFIRDIPVVGNPLADLTEPDLRVLVNLGYGSVDHGYSTSPPNVQTPFGVFSGVPPQEIIAALNTGTQQGIHAFSHDLGTMLTTPPTGPTGALTHLEQFATNVSNYASDNLTTLSTKVSSALSSPDSFISWLQAANTRVADAISSSASDAYATLLPTADIVNGLVTALPSYDVNLFLDGTEMILSGDITGGLTYALGAPIAADTAAVVLLGGFEFRVIEHAATSIYYDITGKTPPAPGGVGGPQL